MSHQVFKEFDAYEDAIQHADLQMTLRRREQSKWVVGGMNVGQLSLQWGTSGGSMVSEGEIVAGGHVLFVPLNRCAVNTVNGQRLDEGSLMVAQSGSEFCVGADGWNDWFSLFVPGKPTGEDASSGDDVARPVCRVAQVGRRRLNRIRGVVKALVEFEETTATVDQSMVRAAEVALQKLAVASIFGVPQSRGRGRGRPSFDRREMLQLAQDKLALPKEPTCVGDLADSAHVSERTLRRAFHDWFGVSPIRYARLRRFHIARDALLDANPAAATVTAVLAQCGIRDFGRFAGEYRALFGELPSQTLQRGDIQLGK